MSTNKKEVKNMKERVLNWFFCDNADNHDTKEVIGLVAGAAIVVVGLFALGWLVGLLRVVF